MKFFRCFMKDAHARGENITIGSVIHRMIYDPGFRAVVYYRISVYLREMPYFKRLFRLIAALIIVRLTRIPGVEIRACQEIGEGLKMFHPHDIVIGRGCIIGKNVMIYNGVTFGAKNLSDMDENKDVLNRYPIIEDGVTVFTGAKILGPVTIGKNSIVGANSVVTKSFPENSVIAGIPAKIVKERQ